MGNVGQAKLMYAVHQGTYVIKLIGDVRVPICPTLDGFIERMFADDRLRSILVDLSQTDLIDSTALGLLAKIAVKTRKRFSQNPVILSTRPDINRILDTMGFEKVFSIVHEAPAAEMTLAEPPTVVCSDKTMCEKVLEAHKVLMSLSEQNHETFKDVIAVLEEEHPGLTQEDNQGALTRQRIH